MDKNTSIVFTFPFEEKISEIIQNVILCVAYLHQFFLVKKKKKKIDERVVKFEVSVNSLHVNAIVVIVDD